MVKPLMLWKMKATNYPFGDFLMRNNEKKMSRAFAGILDIMIYSRLVWDLMISSDNVWDLFVFILSRIPLIPNIHSLLKVGSWVWISILAPLRFLLWVSMTELCWFMILETNIKDLSINLMFVLRNIPTQSGKSTGILIFPKNTISTLFPPTEEWWIGISWKINWNLKKWLDSNWLEEITKMNLVLSVLPLVFVSISTNSTQIFSFSVLKKVEFINAQRVILANIKKLIKAIC